MHLTRKRLFRILDLMLCISLSFTLWQSFNKKHSALILHLTLYSTLIFTPVNVLPDYYVARIIVS